MSGSSSSRLLVVFVAACGSTWDLREGDALPIGCVEVATFADADGDGWGAGDPTGDIACVTALPMGAAGNALDCDDDDPDVTGFVGRVCPAALDAGGSVAGLVVGPREFVALDATAAAVRYTTAAARCEGWAEETSATARDGQRGLATLQDSAELRALPAWLDGLPGVSSGYAAFVDLSWDEPSESWRWPDGSPPDGLPFCDGPPELGDLLDDIAPADPQADERLAEVARDGRLALIRGASGWCWGAPIDAGFPAPEALAICERPAPNPVDYAAAAL